MKNKEIENALGELKKIGLMMTPREMFVDFIIEKKLDKDFMEYVILNADEYFEKYKEETEEEEKE